MKFLIFFVLLLGVAGCDDKPLVNSEEYLELHGIVNGKENNIQIGGYQFSIPKEYRVEVQTYGEIEYGKADVLYFWLDFSDLLSDWVGAASQVRVEVRSFKELDEIKGSESADNNLKELIRSSPKEYSGLIEVYRGDGGWSYRNYIGTFNGGELKLGKVELNCSGTERIGLDACWGAFDKNGLSVWFYISDRLLPKWKFVISEINERISSMIKE